MANELSDILPDLIDDHQAGFVKGRNILDCIVIARDVIQYVVWHKESTFLLKLDFEKAYEMVEWDCVIETLISSGCGDRWVCGLRCSEKIY